MMTAHKSLSNPVDALAPKGIFDLETLRAGFGEHSSKGIRRPNLGQSAYRPTEKLVNCPKCRGYNLERQWCDLCDGKGYVKEKP